MNDLNKLYQERKKYLKQIEDHLTHMSALQNDLQGIDDQIKINKIQSDYKRAEKYYSLADQKLSVIENEINNYKLKENKDKLKEENYKNLRKNIRHKLKKPQMASNYVNLGADNPYESNKPNNYMRYRRKPEKKVDEGIKTKEDKTLYDTIKEKDVKAENEQVSLLREILDFLKSGKKDDLKDKKDDKKKNKKNDKNDKKKIVKKSSSKSGSTLEYIVDMVKDTVLTLGLGGATTWTAMDIYDAIFNEKKSKNIVRKETDTPGANIKKTDNLIDLKNAPSTDLRRENLKNNNSGIISRKLYESDTWKKTEKSIKNYGMKITEGYSDPKLKVHKSNSRHYKGIAIDLRTKDVTRSTKEDDEGKLNIMIMRINSLFEAGARKIVFEYDKETPIYVINELKKIEKQKSWAPGQFFVRQSKGHEHLDVVFDDKFAIDGKGKYSSAKDNIKTIVKPENKYKNPFLDMLGIDHNELKNILGPQLNSFESFMKMGGSTRANLKTSGFWLNKEKKNDLFDIKKKEEIKKPINIGNILDGWDDNKAKPHLGIGNILDGWDDNKVKRSDIKIKMKKFKPQKRNNNGYYTTDQGDKDISLLRDALQRRNEEVRQEENQKTNINAPNINAPTTNNNDNKTIIINNNYDTKTISGVSLTDVNAYV
jgi:hypothetical protein